MKYLSIILIILISSCGPTIYLSNVGQIADFDKDIVKVVFPCENVKRPDCFAAAIYSRQDFPFPYIGQKVILKNYDEIHR